MILYIFAISLLFFFEVFINAYTSPFYFYLDVTIPIIIFFVKELKFIKFVIISSFIIFLNVLLEKFALLISIYIFLFSLLLFYSKKFFNIISIRYIFLSVLIFLTAKNMLVYILFYKNIFNKVLLFNILFNILVNSIFSIFVFYFLEYLINQLRIRCEKALCSS